jgi:hypothetical protein
MYIRIWIFSKVRRGIYDLPPLGFGRLTPLSVMRESTPEGPSQELILSLSIKSQDAQRTLILDLTFLDYDSYPKGLSCSSRPRIQTICHSVPELLTVSVHIACQLLCINF